MPDFVVTGKKGNGKTLSMIDLIYRYVSEGRIIATNLDLYLEHLFSPTNNTCRIMRVPDLPSSADLELIGVGNPSRNEDMNGALILDELAISLNSRTYQDRDRQKLINWMVEARKMGWDIYYLVQDISMLDKQVREGLAEHVVYCRRLDRVGVPFLGPLLKFFTGSRLKLPRIHVATVKYGTGPHAPTADRWTYRGDKYFKAYDTRQRFRADYQHGTFSYLPPYILRYRSFSKRTGEFYMRLTKIYLRTWSRVTSFVVGASVAVVAALLAFTLIIDPVSVAADVPLPPAPVSDHEKDQLQDLRILSYSALPGRQPIYYLQGKGGKFTSTELTNKGFNLVVHNKKHISFVKGDYHASAFGN